jgi:hypothetical protein
VHPDEVASRDASQERGGRPTHEAREIAAALAADKAPEASRKQSKDLQEATLAALWKRDGPMVVGVGAPAGGRLGLRPQLSCNRACGPFLLLKPS